VGCLKYPVWCCTLVLLKTSQEQVFSTKRVVHEKGRERTSSDHRYGHDRWALVVRNDHDMRRHRQHLGAKLEGNKHGTQTRDTSYKHPPLHRGMNGNHRRHQVSHPVRR